MDLRSNPTFVNWSRAARHRRLSLAILTGILTALLLASACSPEGEGLLTTADRNAFTELGEQYTQITNQILEQMNAAAGKGDFAGIDAATGSLFTQAKEQIGKMQVQADKLKGNPQTIAGEMISIANKWIAAATDAIDSGKKNDEAGYKMNVDKLNTLGTEFNAKIREWNEIQAK